MPNLKSAIKRVRTNESAKARNISQISGMRTAIKQFEKAQAAKADDQATLFNAAIRSIDMAKSKGLIKANKAARDKSRLAKLLAD
ncbi:30S ribosomal protein S20 [Loigolactobacillus bifermentans]|jgi:small subunit ribosomal protein S20|nr:30S ribosomal protein S20 [Loigolactobacillus bifermentans]QGG59236.1 30S ribosomal protein S20 [Loigolactobacillus bifermentans]